jgi:outer membrane protein TolC
MRQIQSALAVLCVYLVASPAFAQQQNFRPQPGEDTTPRIDPNAPGEHWYSRFTNKYEPRIVPPVNVSNSGRLDQLIRAGNLYLSLQDAIALALENNIDIEMQRYGFQLADIDVTRTKTGASARGVATGTAAGASSVQGGPGYFVGSAASGIGTTGGAGGPLITSFDPTLTGQYNWAHFTQPSNNTITTGTTSQVTQQTLANFGVTQGFSSGTFGTFSYNNTLADSNAIRNNFNPTTNSFFDLQVTQHLLQGFGFAINTRYIRIANNNLKVADDVFRTQVMNTVSNVINLYWNLVSYNENVRVAQEALAYSQKLLDDNQKQVDIGTLAPIEITRAQAQVATSQQTLLTAQTSVLQQETILKNALSRNGTANESIANVHVIPTDHIEIPKAEPVEPLQDLLNSALANRPDLAQARIQLDNARINLSGTRNSLLPQLDLVGDARNNALSGTPNAAAFNGGQGLTQASAPDPFFIGGYGNVLSQLFGRNFPTYQIGVQLSLPLRNRSAQADYATATVQLRQNELSLQKQISQIRVDVQNALIQRQQARAQYDAAVQARILQEKTLDAEQKKFQLGSSTPFFVIQAQRDLATAEQSEVAALTTYGLAKVQVDQVLGLTLERNGVSIDEAKSGKVQRQSNPVIPR